MVCDEDKVGDLPRKVLKMINELQGLIHVGRLIMLNSLLHLK
jgi:hypothetical protein